MIERPSATSARYVSLATAGAGGSSPILFASSPIGGALLSTGLMTLAGATASSMVPILPVRMSGIDVHETLHRLDTGAHTTESDGTIAAANRIGEALATITMRWLIAPEAFEATPSAAPEDIELDASASQRFVMRDGVLRFQDRGSSGMRFFGAGRTYPTQADGATRLLFAGAAVVVEGLGSLKNLHGSLTIVGEISARSLVSLTLSGRFDDNGPFEAAERLGPIVDRASGGLNATVFTLIGESTGASANGDLEELVRSARIDNDLANGTHPRSLFHVSSTLGRATGPLGFDAAERRCAVRLADARREFTFCDRGGRTVATIAADALEGTALKDHHAGVDAARVIAYGPLSAGSGGLAGAGGVLTLDTVVAADGAAASVYRLWLVDPHGRFRTAETVASRPSAVIASPPAGLGAAESLHLDAATAASMLPEDIAILSHVEHSLADGNAILAWFHDKEETGDYMECFDVAAGAGLTESFGFFDAATINGAHVPLMGIVREMFFDREKSGTVDETRPQLQAFVLRYFLRVCGDAHQVYYRREGGQIGKFAFAERSAIVDLREIGGVYQWITLKAHVATFELPFAPFGSATPRLEVPVPMPGYLVIGPAFVMDISERRKGVAAEFGFGYALMPWGNFQAAIQTVRFRLLATGEIRVRAALIMNRPETIAAVDVDPIGWGMQMADRVTFHMASRLMGPMLALADNLPLRASGVDPVAASIWMANAITGGAAEKRFGISKAVLEKRMLLQHFKQHEDMLHRSLHVWRMMPDWTAHEELPDYCRKGIA